jgi:hypothetical protein
LTQAVPLAAVSLASLGNPLTTTPLMLGATGSVTLPSASGFACLTLAATKAAGWPSLLGVVVTEGTSTGSFNLAVVYNAPGGAAGLLRQIVLEQFTGLTLGPSDPSYAPKAINAQSVLIQVPATYTPPATPPGSFPATPTMLQNLASVSLQDLSSPPVAYLTLQPNTAGGWPAFFGVSAGPSAANPADFDLQVQYAPRSGALGVTLPVTVEEFASLTLATAAAQINPSSDLVQVEGFARTSDSSLSASDLVNVDPTEALPVITLTGTSNQATQTWLPVQDLLESGESDTVFAVEIDTDGTALLRFGDNTSGAAPDAGTVFTGTMRIGNGTAGNVGADSLVYLAAGDARFQSCRNPLPASGGTDPETNAQIRRRAPQAFMTQERAVTMADYETVAQSNAQVDRAVASLRWTGSWYTVFIAVEPQGGGSLTPPLARTLKRTIDSYRLAGQDLQLDSAQYVSLEIELVVCVDPSYFQSDVEQSLLQVLGDRILPNGQKGLFYPDNFTFGQTVYLSPIYAAARSVSGVVTVMATKFQPQGVHTGQYLAAGEIPLGSLQIARLENDPSYPDHGQLTLVMEGGK